MNDPRGSVWRKWDLHIHTPASFHWNGGKQFREMLEPEKESVLSQMARRLRESDVACFAIMDYWTFEGYWKLRDYLAGSGQALDKTVFPGMELRIDAPVDYRLNIQVILSDSLSRQQLQDFKGALKIGTIDRPLSDESLIEFAGQLDTDVARKYGFSQDDLKDRDNLLRLGSMTAKITRESLKDARRLMPSKKCLIIMPYDTSDGLKNLNWEKHPYDDTYFMQSAHIFETRDPDNIDLFLNKPTEKNERFIENFLKTLGGRPKPAVSGSDAHKIADYGVFPSKRTTWIKADTEFDGLVQTINEPAGRTFIGEVPPKVALVQQKRTKYIQSVEIRRKSGATIGEKWFDNAMPINPDLVAVIGNKGKGKSALTDTIGLLANTKQHSEFTFLSEKNFRQPKDNKARHFQATLTWVSGLPITKGLEQEVDEQQPELVKYIPQNFLETICTQLGGIEETQFDHELKKVIFSHVDAASRLGKTSLDDLIAYKTTEANEKLQILRQEMHKINEEIVLLEERSQPEYRQTIDNLLRVKNEELGAHDRSRPEEMEEPTNDPKKQQEIASIGQRLVESKGKLGECDAQIASAVIEEAKQAQLISVVDKLLSRVENLDRQVQTFVANSVSDLATVGLEVKDVVQITIDRRPLAGKRELFDQLMRRAEGLQDASKPGSPAAGKIAIERAVDELQASLDEPNKKWQAYLTSLKTWQDQREAIIGSEDAQDTIKFYEKQLLDLDAIPPKLLAVKANRLAKAKELHGVIRQLAATYRGLYAPVNEFIETRPLARDKFVALPAKTGHLS